jgi:hypothetical protein
MAGRKEFFEVTIDFDQLESHARSNDSTLRWAAAVELAQLGTEEGISLLWSLTTDLDDYVRDAAQLGLKNCDQVLVGKVLASKWAIVEDADEKSGTPATGVAKHIPWKVRPLEVPSEANEWAVDAAILNIIQTEGPITGPRILRLYGMAAYPNNPRKLPKSRIQTAVKRLERRGLVTYFKDFEGAEIEAWTIFRQGSPEVVIREQGMRKLQEIPVTEIIARVRYNMGDDYEYSSQNDRFKVLQSVYALRQADLHIVGELLAREWSLFLN